MGISFDKSAIAKAINRPEPGLYSAQITKCTVGITKNGHSKLSVSYMSDKGDPVGTDYLALPAGEDDENQPHEYWLEQSLLKISKLLEISGKPLEIESVEDLPKLLLGTKLEVLVEHSIDEQGMVRVQVADVFAGAPEEKDVKVSKAETTESSEAANIPKHIL